MTKERFGALSMLGLYLFVMVTGVNSAAAAILLVIAGCLATGLAWGNGKKR